MKKILKKIEIVRDWYDDMTGGEYWVSNPHAYELIQKLKEKNKMGKEEIAKIVQKIKIAQEWFDDMTGGEYSVTIEEAFELIKKLDLVR